MTAACTARVSGSPRRGRRASASRPRAAAGTFAENGSIAAYAPYMEARYGFVRLAAQNWQQIVSRNAREARRRVLG